MIPHLLMQQSTFERVQAVQKYLGREGSYLGMLWALLALAGFLAVVVVIHKLHRRATGGDVRRPKRLFRKLLRNLELTVPQRDLLLRMSRSLRLENPTVLLLGLGAFDRYSGQWLNHGRGVRRGDEERLRQVAEAMFGGG